MEALINSSIELDYEIFYTLTLKKEFADEYKNIFNYNLDSIEKLKESFDFQNFSFENFYQLLKLFDDCDTQRKNFRTLALKFLRDRYSLDNFVKEDENLILNKLKIHAEMKEKIIEHQYNKLVDFSNENDILRKELEKIKKDFNIIKNSLQSNNPNSKAANANLINKKTLLNKNNNLNNQNNNASNVNGTKSKILKKTKTPTKINNTANKTSNLLSTNNINNHNNNKDANQSNANSSMASKLSMCNNKPGEILNATFRASKASLSIGSNNYDISCNNLISNTNLTPKINKIDSYNKGESSNASKINKQNLLSSSKKSEFKSQSKITHRKNNSLCDKTIESHLLRSSPSIKAEQGAECAATPESKHNLHLNSLNKNNPSKSGNMNITMKVNNINNFNSSIHANIISNSAGSINKDFLEAHSNSLINYSNLNTNSNLLNDSFNNNMLLNNNNLNPNENLLKKIMNLDFLGETCNIISNSPINSPRIKLSSNLQTESSLNNFSGGSAHINNLNNLNSNVNNNLKNSSVYASDYTNHPSCFQNNDKNMVKTIGVYDDKDYEMYNKNYKNSTKYNYQENSDPIIKGKDIHQYDNSYKDSDRNFDENTPFDDECLGSNSTYSQSEHFNRNNQISKNQKRLKNIDNIQISNNQMLSSFNETNKTVTLKSIDYNTNNNNNNNSMINSDKKIRENSHDTSDRSENKNSPCFMREHTPAHNPTVNSNCFGNTQTLNEYKSNPQENPYGDVKHKTNYENLNDIQKNKKNCGFGSTTQQGLFEDEKPKDLEYTKTERYSSSIPRKRVLKGKNLLTKFDENSGEKISLDCTSVIISNSKISPISQMKKNNIGANAKSKKNFFEAQLTSTPKNSAINKSNNINPNNNNVIQKSLTPRKNNLTQKNPLNNNNSVAGNFNKQRQKVDSHNSPNRLKKGHSNSIDIDQAYGCVDKISDNHNNTQYQRNYSNYNTEIKKRKQKQSLELYESENLNTHFSWTRQKLDVSDVTYQNTMNKSDLYEYAPDAEKFQTYTCRGLTNPKKPICVEKMPDDPNQDLNYNNKHQKNLFEINSIDNQNNQNFNDNKKINVIKISKNNIRDNALINNCSIGSSSSFNEEPNRPSNENLSGFSTLINLNVKNESKKNTRLNNNSVILCNPNFKESKLAMGLLKKSSNTQSSNSSNINSNNNGFSRNNDVNTNNNNFNLKLNATLNSINELKKKMNL